MGLTWPAETQSINVNKHHAPALQAHGLWADLHPLSPGDPGTLLTGMVGEQRVLALSSYHQTVSWQAQGKGLVMGMPHLSDGVFGELKEESGDSSRKEVRTGCGQFYKGGR